MEKEFERAMQILFPGGRESIDAAVKNIRNSFSGNVGYDELYGVYVSFKFLLSVHQINTPNIQDNVDYLVGYIQRKLESNHNYSECYELIQCMADNDVMILSWINNFGFGSFEEAEIGDESGEDLGYSIDNPIKTAGIAYSKRYLDHLYKANMGSITYNRKGSKENINLGVSKSLKRLDAGMGYSNPCYRCVDIYEIYDDNGNFLTDLYVCPYYKSNTTRAPRGFKYTG